jgi:geranylgeranyl diphosphate synthase type II
MVQTALEPILADFTQQARPRIEAALACYAEAQDGCPTRLLESMRHSLLTPGKRLRPLLVVMAAQACEASLEAALPAACAVEMIHVYSLIHDDLPAMDDDDLRRGKPTNHKVFGEATAILAGDALLTRAFEILARDLRPAQTAVECCAALARAAGATGMVGGQVDDLYHPLDQATLESLESTHARKTGALLEVSLELGALVGSATSIQREALCRYGRLLGLAFQITDDLLDVAGDEAALGKRVGKDAQRGKLTFPGLLGLEESKFRARHLISEACQAIDIFAEHGRCLEALARYVLERDR